MPNPENSAIGNDAAQTENLSSDAIAQRELASFEHGSRLELKRTFHGLFILGLRILGLVAILIVLIRAYHLVAPTSWCWMDVEQVQSLDKILFSGSVGGVLGRYLNQIIPKDSR
jgi:hypothetical protein